MEDNSTAADVEDEYQQELEMYSMFMNCLGNSLQAESFMCVVETPQKMSGLHRESRVGSIQTL
jgi:hypothetical protein